MTEFRNSFHKDKYEDERSLANLLLLPVVTNGHRIYLATAFTTSYIFQLVREMALGVEDVTGHLDLVFYVNGDLKLKSSGVARFKNYLNKYATSELEVAQFVADVLFLTDEGKLRASIAHTKQKSPLVRGCLGVVVSGEVPEQGADRDYVSFVDTKAGDHNSPIFPLKSWLDEDYFYAQDLLAKITPVINGSRSNVWRIADEEIRSWFEYLDEWYEDNPPVAAEAEEQEYDPEDPQQEEDLDFDDDILQYLKSHSDFRDEDRYEWFEGEDSPYDFDISKYFSRFVRFEESQLERGHIPPEKPSYLYGSTAEGGRCPGCGELFFLVDGCPSIDWSYTEDPYSLS